MAPEALCIMNARTRHASFPELKNIDFKIGSGYLYWPSTKNNLGPRNFFLRANVTS